MDIGILVNIIEFLFGFIVGGILFYHIGKSDGKNEIR